MAPVCIQVASSCYRVVWIPAQKTFDPCRSRTDFAARFQAGSSTLRFGHYVVQQFACILSDTSCIFSRKFCSHNYAELGIGRMQDGIRLHNRGQTASMLTCQGEVSAVFGFSASLLRMTLVPRSFPAC